MITSAMITKLRRKYNDLPRSHEDQIAGDGASTVYQTRFSPIKESSFRLYVNNSLRAASAYTIDYDTGDLQLGAATSGTIKVQYQEVKFRDQSWLEFIQEGIGDFGDTFYRSAMRNPSAVTLSAGKQVYDMPSACIRLLEVLESDDFTSAGNFKRPGVNISYDRRSNKMILGNKPTRANYLQISYLKKLAKPTATSSVLDLEDNWLDILDKKVGAIQARSYADRISKQGNVSVEEGALSVAQLRALANDNEIIFRDAIKKNRPVLPAISIPFYIPTGGPV